MVYMLQQLGQSKPKTKLKTNNVTANDFVHNNIMQKNLNSDMRYYWLRDNIVQNQLDIYWDRGKINHANYFFRHHKEKYHQEI